MSTGLECLFDEVRQGEWWYVLESRFEDDEPGDWMESADAYGPFATFDLAHDDLDRNHANPGGFTVARWHEGKGEPDAHMRRLMEEAGARDDVSRGSPFSFR